MEQTTTEEEVEVSDSKLTTLSTLSKHYIGKKKSTLKPGDTVKWKKGLKCLGCPEYGEPAIVLEKFKKHIKVMDDSNSWQFGASYDIKIGVMNGDTFQTFPVESWRFEEI